MKAAPWTINNKLFANKIASLGVAVIPPTYGGITRQNAFFAPTHGKITAIPREPQDLIFPLSFLISGISAFIAISQIEPEFRSLHLISEILLGRILVTNVGLFGVIAFLLHYFRGDTTAKDLGWPTRSPFQKETAFADLAMGILGILCLFMTGAFWIATVIFASFYFSGAVITHLIELISKRNLAPLNSGFLLIYEFLLPVMLVALLILSR